MKASPSTQSQARRPFRWREGWGAYVALRALPWFLLALSLAVIFQQANRPAALIQVWVPWAEVGMIALAMTPIILAGGIDLSAGGILVLAATLLGFLWQQYNLPIWWCVPVVLLCGTLAGLGNGMLVNLSISPLVATLATMAFYNGLAMWVSNAQRVTGFPDTFLRWGTWGSIPLPLVFLPLVFLVVYLAVHHTVIGRWCLAMGDNRAAARAAGVPVAGVQWLLYASSGLVAALVAVLYVMLRNAAVPDAHRGIELKAIACVVVGGTLITGGRGGAAGTLLGVAVLSSLDVALGFLHGRLAGLTAEARMVVFGILLVTVAIGNQWMERQRWRWIASAPAESEDDSGPGAVKAEA